MAKRDHTFVCQSCGAVYSRWQGKCDACGAWNTLSEEVAVAASVPAAQRSGRKGRAFALESLEGAGNPAPRLVCGIGELDRVAGGGFVPGSILLIGGDPGIGKSTLLVQASAALARRGLNVVYVSGEEAVDQVRMRAQRLGLAGAKVGLAAETNAENILATLSGGPPVHVVVIDSIQTMWSDSVESAPGTVHPGAHLGPVAGALRQADRGLRDPGRARDQGRPDRRPPGGGAHGGRGVLVRGRRRPPVPRAARAEEPLRPPPTRSACSR